jgi:hypothetical protein
MLMIRPPSLDRPEAEFLASAQGDGLVTPPVFVSMIGTLLPIAPVWPFLVVVSAPSLQLFDRSCEGQEPVLVQAFGAEPAIEGEEG